MIVVTVDTDRCLQYNYKKAECNRCVISCPQECWQAGGKVDSTKCDGCGLCVSSCPVDAIGVEGITTAAWNEAADGETAEVHLACKAKNNGAWGCLGFLSASDLFSLAWHGKADGRSLTLHDGLCGVCRPAVATHVAGISEKAEALLSLTQRGRLLHDEKGLPNPEETEKLARRAFFGALFKAGSEAVRNAVWPDEGGRPIDRNHWRARTFIGNVAFPDIQTQPVFPSVQIASTCIACGLCSKICPFGALQAEDRVTFLELRFYPVACTACGLCVAHCPEDSIRLGENGPLPDYVAHQQDFPRCNECGEVFQPAGAQLTCFECLMKGRRSIFEP